MRVHVAPMVGWMAMFCLLRLSLFTVVLAISLLQNDFCNASAFASFFIRAMRS